MNGQQTKSRVKGFSMKDNNLTGTYYLWGYKQGSYDKEYVKKRREEKGNGNYSKMEWICFGSYPTAVPLLMNHLKEVYGQSFSEEEVNKRLQERYQELEDKRIRDLVEVNLQINKELKRLGRMTMTYEGTVNRGKRILYQLKKEE